MEKKQYNPFPVLGAKHLPIIAVCGLKNSGKTTLIEALIPLLKAKGIRLAVVKHDGHDFVPDAPGTDSYRFNLSGAKVSAVFSSNRYLVSVEKAETTLKDLLPFIDGVDLVLMEGGKTSPYPKIEIARSSNSQMPVAESNNLLAVCTDMDFKINGVEFVALDNYQKLVEIIVCYLQQHDLFILKK
jgi:molybdopterin-guanine dinucleotide biosynthesis protein B